MEDLFGSLRSDVEAVFMQAPTVQLEAVATKVEAMSPHLEELVSLLPECICLRMKLAALLTALNSHPIKPKVRPSSSHLSCFSRHKRIHKFPF